MFDESWVNKGSNGLEKEGVTKAWSCLPDGSLPLPSPLEDHVTCLAPPTHHMRDYKQSVVIITFLGCTISKFCAARWKGVNREGTQPRERQRERKRDRDVVWTSTGDPALTKTTLPVNSCKSQPWQAVPKSQANFNSINSLAPFNKVKPYNSCGLGNQTVLSFPYNLLDSQGQVPSQLTSTPLGRIWYPPVPHFPAFPNQTSLIQCPNHFPKDHKMSSPLRQTTLTPATGSPTQA